MSRLVVEREGGRERGVCMREREILKYFIDFMTNKYSINLDRKSHTYLKFKMGFSVNH